METGLYLDTHAVLWLHSGDSKVFSKRVIDLLETSNLFVSPMCLLEIDYLFEIRKIAVRGEDVFKNLHENIDLQIAPDSFYDVVHSARNLHWTRDPFDRLIVAQASLHKAPLISKDETVRRHYSRTVW